MRTFQAFVGGFLVVLAISGSARGEESGAEALFREGVRALRANRYPEAASLFRLSYNMERQAATMCNLALTYERWGRDREALESYRQCAEDDRTGRFRDHALERTEFFERRLGRQREPLALPRFQPRPTQPRQQTSPVQQPPLPVQQPQPTVQQSSRRVRHGIAYIGIGVGVLGLGGVGTAIGLNVWASGVYDDMNEQYGYEIPENSAAEDRIDRGQRGTYAALGLYLGGGICFGVGILLVILDAAGVRIGSSASNTSARFSIASSRNGLALSLSFPTL